MQNFLNRLFGNPPVNEPPARTPAEEEMVNLLKTAAAALEQRYFDTALETYQRGLTLARTIQDRANEERFLSGIAAVSVAREDYDAALPVLDQAYELARTLDNQRALARTLNNLGSFHAHKQNWGAAQKYHERALEAARPSGDAEMIVLALENLARDYLEQDNPSYAQHLLKEAVVVTQAGQQVKLASRVLGLLGETSLRMNERVTGQRLLTQAINLAEQTGQSEEQLKWLQMLAELEIENRRYAKAVEYYQAAENLALRLGNQATDFFMESALQLSTAYQMSGDSEHAEEYATRALAQARSTENAAQEANALMRLGMAAYTVGQYDRAESFLGEAMQYYEDNRLDDRNEHLTLLLTLGNIYARRAKPEDALKVTQQALQLAQDTDNPTREAEALHLIGTIASTQGHRAQALNHWQEALSRLRSTDYTQAAQIRCDIAQARKTDGDFKAALAEYERALLLLNNIKHGPTRGLVLSNAATLYTETGDVDTAEAFYQESIEIARQMNDPRAESLRLGNFAWFHALTGHPRRAVDELELALKLSRELDDTLLIAVQTNNLARTYYQLEDYETARTLHKQAIAAATAIDSPRWQALFQADMGQTMIALNRIDEAEDLFQAALEKATAASDQETQVHAHARLGALYIRTGKLIEANRHIHDAEIMARRMSYYRGLAEALAAGGELARAQSDTTRAQSCFSEAHRLYTMLRSPNASVIASFLPENASSA